MPKTVPYFLSLVILLTSLISKAQTEQVDSIKVKSCSQRLKEFQEEVKRGNPTNKKLVASANTIVNAGSSVLISTLSVSKGMLGGTAIGLGAQLGITLVIGGTKAAIRKHRRNIALILEGAGLTGGNAQTQKLWKLANKKNKEAFKDITYKKFLTAIHKADLSGEACQFEDVPEKREIIEVLIDGKELFEEEPLLGEKDQSAYEGVVGSERKMKGKDSLTFSTNLGLPNIPGAKEY